MAILIFTPISDANVVPPFATTFLSFLIDIVVISYLVILDFIDYYNTYLSFWTKACFTQKGIRMTSPMEKNSTTTSYPAGIATKTFRTYSLLARQEKCLTINKINKIHRSEHGKKSVISFLFSNACWVLLYRINLHKQGRQVPR